MIPGRSVTSRGRGRTRLALVSRSVTDRDFGFVSVTSLKIHLRPKPIIIFLQNKEPFIF